MVKSVGGPGNWAGGGCSKHFCLLGVATLLLDVISGRILNLSFHSSFCLHMLALSLPCRFLLEFALLGRGACLKSMSSNVFSFFAFSCLLKGVCRSWGGTVVGRLFFLLVYRGWKPIWTPPVDTSA